MIYVLSILCFIPLFAVVIYLRLKNRTLVKQLEQAEVDLDRIWDRCEGLESCNEEINQKRIMLASEMLRVIAERNDAWANLERVLSDQNRSETAVGQVKTSISRDGLNYAIHYNDPPATLVGRYGDQYRFAHNPEGVSSLNNVRAITEKA